MLACLCAVLAGCAARASLGTEAVRATYAAGGGQYDDGPSVVFLTRAFEQGGMTDLCGVRTARAMRLRAVFTAV